MSLRFLLLWLNISYEICTPWVICRVLSQSWFQVYVSGYFTITAGAIVWWEITWLSQSQCFVHQLDSHIPPIMWRLLHMPAISTPFFRSLGNLYSFDPYLLAKMRKMSYLDPYFSSKLSKMYSFDPPFFYSTLVAFRVDGRWWASLSETWPSAPIIFK